MGTASVTLDAIRERLAHHRETLRREFRVARLAVFGSYARGTARKRSDVDILVDFEPSGIIFDNTWNSSSTCSAFLGGESIW